MDAQGTFVAMNNRVSQSVAHLHVHVVPRTKGDGLRGFFWPRTKYADGEAESYAERLRAVLQRPLAAYREFLGSVIWTLPGVREGLVAAALLARWRITLLVSPRTALWVALFWLLQQQCVRLAQVYHFDYRIAYTLPTLVMLAVSWFLFRRRSG